MAPIEDDGKADVSCPVCKEIFLGSRIPKILPSCSHTVCLICLGKIREQMTSIRCPLCMVSQALKGSLESLTTNLTMKSFADKYNRAAIKKGASKDTSSGTGEFQIFIKTLEEKTIILDVRETTTIAQVKVMIQQRENVNPENQRIIFSGKPLTKMDDKTIKACGITKDAVLHLMRRMQGGDGRSA